MQKNSQKFFDMTCKEQSLYKSWEKYVLYTYLM